MTIDPTMPAQSAEDSNIERFLDEHGQLDEFLRAAMAALDTNVPPLVTQILGLLPNHVCNHNSTDAEIIAARVAIATITIVVDTMAKALIAAGCDDQANEFRARVARGWRTGGEQ